MVLFFFAFIAEADVGIFAIIVKYVLEDDVVAYQACDLWAGNCMHHISLSLLHELILIYNQNYKSLLQLIPSITTFCGILMPTNQPKHAHLSATLQYDGLFRLINDGVCSF